MIEKTLAKRYAAAMLAVALKEGAVPQVEEQLLALREAYRSDVAFRRALSLDVPSLIVPAMVNAVGAECGARLSMFSPCSGPRQVVPL